MRRPQNLASLNERTTLVEVVQVYLDIKESHAVVDKIWSLLVVRTMPMGWQSGYVLVTRGLSSLVLWRCGSASSRVQVTGGRHKLSHEVKGSHVGIPR